MGLFSKKKNSNKQLYLKRLKEFSHNAFDKEFDWDWKAVPYNRVAIVNRLIQSIGDEDARYLEIGCATNALFHAVACKHKIGVDPASGGTHRMTSDAFFEQNEEAFDVVFIDGLHEYAQVHRDTINALKCLKPGGWIAFHDLLPRSWKEHHVPILNRLWTGDCWKAAFEIAQSEGLAFKIVLADHGVGILRKTDEATDSIADLSAMLNDKQFQYFYENIDKLPLIEADKALTWIDQKGI